MNRADVRVPTYGAKLGPTGAWPRRMTKLLASISAPRRRASSSPLVDTSA